MKEAPTPQNDDRMDPRFHGEMIDLGWRLPRAEGDVRAAEEFVADAPGGLPERLQDDGELPLLSDKPMGREGLLARYLRDGAADSRPTERGRDEQQRGRGIDRG